MLTYFVLFAAPVMAGKFNMPKVDIKRPIETWVWDIQEDPAKSIYDAVIVEDTTEVTSTGINRYRKIRVLSEKGKEAAQFVDPTGKAKKIEGRVVDVSGNQVLIDKKEDLVEVLDYKRRGDTSKTRILVPPGLTTDCVVELSWQIFAVEGLPEGMYRQDYFIQEGFFIKKKFFKIDNSGLRGRGSYLVSRAVWTPVKEPALFTAEKHTNDRTLIYENVPAMKAHPYGNMYLDPSAAFVSIFKTFPNFGQKPEQFWKRFGTESLKEHMNPKFSKSKKYKEWLAKLKASLPEDHIKATMAVFDALRHKVAATDMLPPGLRNRYSEVGVETEKENWLSEVFESGIAYPWQMGFLFFRVAMDCDLPIRVAFTNAATEAPIQPGALDPFSLSHYYPFFAVKQGENQWIYLAPAWQEYAPGFMPPHYQGGPVMLFDPHNKWTCEVTRTQRFAANAHQLVRQYALNISQEGAITFTVNEKGSGIYNSRKLTRYFPKTVEEQVEQLTEYWQDRLDTYRVSEAKLLGADSLNGMVEAVVSGEKTVDLEGEKWLTLNPFPGDTLPLATPEIWPKDRKQPIILPHQLNQIDISKISIPLGWSMRGNPNWEKVNSIGKVSMKAVQNEGVITIRRDILVSQDILGPGAESDLKYFLAWTEEAGNQQIGLNLGGGK